MSSKVQIRNYDDLIFLNRIIPLRKYLYTTWNCFQVRQLSPSTRDQFWKRNRKTSHYRSGTQVVVKNVKMKVSIGNIKIAYTFGWLQWNKKKFVWSGIIFWQSENIIFLNYFESKKLRILSKPDEEDSGNERKTSQKTLSFLFCIILSEILL